jgi:hypothetical protein
VSVVDADVLIAHPLDEIWAAPDWLQLIYTRGGYCVTCECVSMLPCAGQMVAEPFQGGLWTIRPNPSTLSVCHVLLNNDKVVECVCVCVCVCDILLTIQQHMQDLVRRGAWYEGSGWERSGVGWLYGGPTVQVCGANGWDV